MVPSDDAILATRTTTRLLDALHESRNEPAWSAIDARYRPVIAGLARRLGLGATDADDAAQQAIVEFMNAYRNGRYDRTKGRLSSWIMGIAHHTALHLLRDRRRAPAADASAVGDAPDERTLRTLWDEERDRAIIARALGLLRDESQVDDRTLLAFELVALRGVPAPEAAAQAGMSTEQVYVAKSRLTRRLRELVQKMTEAFEEDL